MSKNRQISRAPTRAQMLEDGEHIDRHSHSSHQLIYSSHGLLHVSTAEGHWIAPPDRAIWIPRGVEHEHSAHGHVHLHLVGVDPRHDLLKTSLPCTVEVSPLLRELIRAHTTEASRDTPRSRRLEAVLWDHIEAAPQRQTYLPAPSTPLLAAVAQIFFTEPADGRTLAELGRAVGASERTLSRLFHTDIGMSFPRWRTRLRLQHARTLLAEGSDVTTTAYRCGWSSASAFISVFKKEFGRTPAHGPR